MHSDTARLRTALALALVVLAVATPRTPVALATDSFRDDDPLRREPETQDASSLLDWKIDLFVDLTLNLFTQPGDQRTGVRAENANTIDEIPDSNWFTNRVLAHPVSTEEAIRGPHGGTRPADGPWTIVAAKEVGAAPGFTVEDQAGETWFVSFDSRGYPEAATGAILVANRIFWTLGYWQMDNVLVHVRPEQVLIGDTATVEVLSGAIRPMRPDDLDVIWQRAHRSGDGSFRAVASRRLPGRPLGGFRYHGTRPDDPNDVVPHEHRRELRALQVFGAWTNLVDMKAGNTLDMLITERGRGVVRHYLQDVGSTFGTGAVGPREFDEGWEQLYEGNVVWKRLVSLGFWIRPWQTVRYQESAAIGRFEGNGFDPLTWKPRVPTAALRHAQPDDLFWAARRVMAFSDDLIRALATAARYTDAAAAKHLADVLIQRRDKIGAAYLTVVNPLVDFHLSASGRLSFSNAAFAARVAPEPRGGYRLTWARFDNHSGTLTPIGETAAAAAGHVDAPARLPRNDNAFVCVRIEAIAPPHAAWTPVRVYFRRAAEGWDLVGMDRSGK
jgi:hypothetical protein